MSSFDYANARLKSWKADLFDSAFFDRLLAAKDGEAVIAMLSRTEYKQDIEKGVIKYAGVSGVEEGLKQNLANTLQKLLKISSESEKANKMVKLIISKWDIYNLKTVLRGYHAKATEDEIFEQSIPVGLFDEAAIRTLAKQPNMKAVIGQLIVLSPQYALSLITGYKQYEKSNNLSNLELGLDKAYFNVAIKDSSKNNENDIMINGVIKREIDIINLMTLLRLTQEALPENTNIDDYFIEGGNLQANKLAEHARKKDIKDLIESLKRTQYYDALKTGYRRYQKTNFLSSIERVLEDYSVHKTVALFRADPLSIATVIAYVWAKINEIINIRIILRGKEVEMPSEQIKEALVIV